MGSQPPSKSGRGWLFFFDIQKAIAADPQAEGGFDAGVAELTPAQSPAPASRENASLILPALDKCHR